MTTLTNLIRADVKEAITCYQPIFGRVLSYPYLDPNYKVLERKVSRIERACVNIRFILFQSIIDILSVTMSSF